MGPKPVPVASLTDAVAVDAGGEHTCALRRGGSVACWGLGRSGNLGNDVLSEFAPAFVPSPVLSLSDATAISAGLAHTCALRTGGGVACWGSGASLGGADGPSGKPVAVSALADVVALSAGGGEHTCAVRADGQVACWGDVGDGSLGHGVAGSSVTPVVVSSLTDAVVQAPSIAVGPRISCVVRAGGRVSCWGQGDTGQLGDGVSEYALTPVTVASLSDAIAVTVGGDHACALRSAGSVVCWGNGATGALGNGKMTNSSVPVAVSSLSDAVAIDAGGGHTCALRRGGAVVCWGASDSGALGNGLLGDSSVPVAVSSLSDAVSVSAGGVHTCAVRANGSVVCWGAGYLGDGLPSWVRPQPVAWP
jgi:alpha-tubulin suppressor-like RCC1 family protein